MMCLEGDSEPQGKLATWILESPAQFRHPGQLMLQTYHSWYTILEVCQYFLSKRIKSFRYYRNGAPLSYRMYKILLNACSPNLLFRIFSSTMASFISCSTSMSNILHMNTNLIFLPVSAINFNQWIIPIFLLIPPSSYM